MCELRTGMCVIREMTAEDLAEVAALEAKNFSMPWSERGFANAIAQKNSIFLVAVTVDGTVGAYGGMYLAADEGEITNVAVAASLRRAGIGAALLRELLDRARAAGAVNVYLEVRRSNEAALALYRQAGFTQIGIRKKFYDKPREDAVVMRCAMD